jgi:hypothetical protein
MIASEKEKAAKAIWKAWSSNEHREHLLAKHGEKATIEITFYVTKGPRDDEDNRLARCKGIIDALVRLGVLWDDSDEFLSIIPPRRERTKGESYLEISVQYPGRD